MSNGNITGGVVDRTSTIGELVAERPIRAGIFEEYGIDYCCGGKLSLEEACRRKGLKVNEVIERLQNHSEGEDVVGEKDWTRAMLKELIDHIVSTYHRPLQHQLSRVLELAEKVARVHGETHPEMVEVFHVFRTFGSQLELHMHKEEMILFPAIASLDSGNGKISFGCGGGLEMPISVMMQEHDEAGEALSIMQKLTNNFTPPSDACNSFRVLLHSLAEINRDMHQHVHKENNILFPRALERIKAKPSTCSH